MSTGDIVTLAAALIALVGSVVSLFISTRLAVGKERRQLLWAAELDRFFELEALAGELIEVLGGYGALPGDCSDLLTKLESLKLQAGRFGRYPEVRQGIRELYQVLACLWAARRDHDKEQRELRGELEPAYRKLLEACDEVLGRDKNMKV